MYKTRGAAVGQGWKKNSLLGTKAYPFRKSTFLGGGFRDLLFSPLLGEMIKLSNIFSDGLKPRTRFEIMMFRTSRGWDMC